MALPLDGLDLAAFSLGSNNLLARLKTGSISGDNSVADGSGANDRFEYNKITKSKQTCDFVVFLDDSDGDAATNLSLTVMSVNGTDYLGSIKSGSIQVTTVTKDVSSVATAYAIPAARKTKVEVNTEVMVFTTATLTNLVLTGSEAEMSVEVLATIGTTVFDCPMLLKSGKTSFGREETTMDKVSLVLKGTPVGPSDSSLLGVALLGNGGVTLSVNTGGNTYATGDGLVAVITRLSIEIADSTIIEMTGTLEIQGPVTVS